jgi:hypothetical protein
MKKIVVCLILIIGFLVLIRITLGHDFYSVSSISKSSQIEKIIVESRSEYAGEYHQVLCLTEDNDIKNYVTELKKGKYIPALYTKLWDPAEKSDFAIKIYSSSELCILQLTKDLKVTVYKFSSENEDNCYSTKQYHTKGYENLYNSLMEKKLTLLTN